MFRGTPQRCAAALVALWVSVVVPGAYGQGSGQLWQQEDFEPASSQTNVAWIQPETFRAFRLDYVVLRERLLTAPEEFAPGAQQNSADFSLPMPDGTLTRFHVVKSSVMAPELAAKFPEIQTYLGQGVDDPAATVRFDVTPAGLHAQILSPRGAVYVEPHRRGNVRRHISYHKRDYRPTGAPFQCGTHEEEKPLLRPADLTVPSLSGGTLRTFRLAVAATGEYTQFHGGTVAAGLAAIVTAINRVNGIYESELAMRLVLVANNEKIVFTNATTDPYSNTDLTAMLAQNQMTIDGLIGDANYDLGQVFSTATGGLSATAVVCTPGSKAKSATGMAVPIGDPFYVDYVAHEIGHEFGAHHTFNGLDGSCAAQRLDSTAYERGSGSTVLAYAGLCGADNLQPHSDPYFHSITYDEIMFYVVVGFGDCAVLTSTGNNPPTISVGAVTNFFIPKGTPFVLTATGSDLDGDSLSYCWEERDRGPAQAASDSDNGASPLFRSFAPTANPTRTFPNLPDILNNTTNLGEMLPTMARTMKFRVSARDNRAGGGGVNAANLQVTVSDSAGPFVVTSPNTPVIWSGLRTVTWNAAGTTSSPINASTVDILLSTDGGLTFPLALATDTPNDGSEVVPLPNIATTTARIKVQAHGGIFFDISDSNFTIAAPMLPVVSIAATEPNATEASAHAGVLIVTRTGPTTNSLAVSYSIAGSASNGVDYALLPGSVTIPAGSASVTIQITPVDDLLAESSETVIITLSTNAGYTIDSTNSSGLVTIADNDDIRITMVARSGNNLILQFNSSVGQSCRVERTDQLSITNSWLPVTGAAAISGTGGTLTVTDTNALAGARRFYRVRVLP